MTRASALGRVFPQISFTSCLRCALSLIQSATRVHIQFYQVPTSRTSSSGPDLTRQPLHALLQPPLSSHSRWEAELRGSTTTATECQKILSFQIVHLLLTCPISVYALRGRQVVIFLFFFFWNGEPIEVEVGRVLKVEPQKGTKTRAGEREHPEGGSDMTKRMNNKNATSAFGAPWMRLEPKCRELSATVRPCSWTTAKL